jgi:FAD:protein FMN transferase
VTAGTGIAGATARLASWPVWTTTATVVVEHAEALPPACAELRGALAAVEAAASRFRADSELSRVNAGAGTWVEVSPLLVILLRAALDAAHDSGGAVDPTVGAALRLAGYDTDIALAGTTTVSVSYLGPHWAEVEVLADQVRVPPGVELDLGATAKAWTADHAAARAAQRTGSAVLVNLGGDIAADSCGERRPFPVIVAEDHRASAGPVVWVGDGGVATSTTTVRRWRHGGRERHHLIDPLTGLPTDGPWRTVTAAAGTCVAANTASTAAIVFGELALPWLRECGLPARLVGTDGAVRTVNGWPADVPYEHSGLA